MLTEARINRLLADIHEGKINPLKLPGEVFEAIADRLLGSLSGGFGGRAEEAARGSQVRRIGESIEGNVRIFSAAKTFQQVKDMSDAITDGRGMKRNFREFEEVARGIFDTYNREWLKTEQRTAFNTGASARQWADIEETKDIFPMLMYRTQGDARVRDEHERMEGIVKPVDDPFWNRYMPPNGFNCRCRKPTQMRDGTPSDVRGAPRPHPLFDMNPGKHGMAFKEDVGDGMEHPYFRVDERYGPIKEEGFGLVD